jgi:hypothetical protein
MWEDIGFVVTVLALFVSIVAIIVTTIFYIKSTQDPKSILDYLQMAINNPDIKPNFNQWGRLINWNVTLDLSGNVQTQASGTPPVPSTQPVLRQVNNALTPSPGDY